MGRYEVKQPYTAARDGRRFGPWEAGDVVELDQVDAEWIERDSPGALAKAKAAKSSGERQQPPAADRQHRGAANRSG